MTKSYFFKYSYNGIIHAEVAYESGVKWLLGERNRLCKKYSIDKSEMPIWSCDDYNPFVGGQKNVKVYA